MARSGRDRVRGRLRRGFLGPSALWRDRDRGRDRVRGGFLGPGHNLPDE